MQGSRPQSGPAQAAAVVMKPQMTQKHKEVTSEKPSSGSLLRNAGNFLIIKVKQRELEGIWKVSPILLFILEGGERWLDLVY